MALLNVAPVRGFVINASDPAFIHSNSASHQHVVEEVELTARIRG